MTKKSIHWKELFVQMISVSFGVLLALWVNQWQSSKRESEDINLALQSLSNEIAFNRRFLTTKIAYYEKVFKEIDSISSTNSNIQRSDVSSFKGLNPPFLRRSSFELCMNTGIFNKIGYSRADNIAQMYAFQDFYLDVVDVMVNQILMNTKGEMDMNDIRGIFQEWMTMGKELTRHYQQVSGSLPEPTTDPGLS